MFLLISCGPETPRPKPPVDPNPLDLVCVLEEQEAPPELQNGSAADYGKPGEPGCGEQWEVCLSKKSAAHYVALQQWADEIFAKCKRK